MRSLAGLIVFLVLLGAGDAAHAHAVLLDSTPPDRAVVAESPTALVLRFNQPVQPVAMRLLDERGTPIDGLTVRAEGTVVRVALPAILPPGAFILSYRVTSADSHPIGGALQFAVGTAPRTWQPSAAAPAVAAGWQATAIIVRALFLVTAMVSVGGLLFLILFKAGEPEDWEPLRPILLSLAMVAVISAGAAIPIQGAVVLGETSDAAQLLWIGLASTRGVASLVAVGGLLVAAGGLMIRARTTMLAGVAVVGASFALSGHAATATPIWIAIPTLLIHVAVVGFWIGSLLPLLVALDAPAAEAARLFHRFSEITLVVVPQLVVAGAILAVLQVQRPAALIETTYGLTLMVKIALVAAMLGLAALNRWVLAPRLAGGSTGARAGLRVSVGIELAAAIAVLCLAAALSHAVPPRSLALNDELRAAAAQAGRSGVLTARRHSAFFSVTPGRPGWNRIRVRVLGPDAQPLEPIAVTVELSLPDAGMEPLTRKLAAAARRRADRRLRQGLVRDRDRSAVGRSPLHR